MVICASFASNTAGDHYGHFMHSIRADMRSWYFGGDKTGDNRWYEVHITLADRLYDEHLEELRKEGLI